MTTQEIRDKLMVEKVRYQNSIEVIDSASKKLKEVIASVTDAEIEMLAGMGININQALIIDTERCKSDKEYLEQKQAEIEAVVAQLHKFLEDSLNV